MTTNSFLTVEDVNSIIYRNQGFYWHEIDTSKISSEYDFDDIKYDFVEVSRETGSFTFDQHTYPYKFTLKITNTQWAKGYIPGNHQSYRVSLSDDALIIYAPINRPTISILLYMGPVAYDDLSFLNFRLVNDTINLNYMQLNTTQSIQVKDSAETHTVNVNLVEGYNNIIYTMGSRDYPCGYLLVKLLKTNFKFNCNQTLAIGKINTVSLGTDIKYKPNGALIGANTPTITVEYNGETLPVTYDDDLNDYTFDLDLTDKTTTGKIHFNVNVETNDVINATSTKVTLDTRYTSISSMADLILETGNDGASTIELNNDITLTSNIIIEHSIKIIGNNHTIDLNEHSIKLLEDTITSIENVSFYNGDTTLIQSKNTELTLTDCTFTNCTSTNYNNLGSCIYCDVDEDSLNNPNDYQTLIENCTFKDNMNCIFHGGQININNTKYHNTDLDYTDKHNVAFLYQTDGTANITNSIFDIDYIDETLCTNEESIGYAQALIQIGTNANINGANAETLRQDNTLPFDSNATHLFAKYYYPQIETCVYTSPTLSHEDKNLCYTVTNSNWIYKQNTQITRASWDTQNETRKIEWED